MVECSAATLSYALGIRDSKNYKGSEIQRLRALRSRFLTATRWWFSSGIWGGPPVLLARCPDLDDPDDPEDEPLEDLREPSLSRRLSRSSRERSLPSI